MKFCSFSLFPIFSRRELTAGCTFWIRRSVAKKLGLPIVARFRSFACVAWDDKWWQAGHLQMGTYHGSWIFDDLWIQSNQNLIQISWSWSKYPWSWSDWNIWNQNLGEFSWFRSQFTTWLVTLRTFQPHPALEPGTNKGEWYHSSLEDLRKKLNFTIYIYNYIYICTVYIYIYRETVCFKNKRGWVHLQIIAAPLWRFRWVWILSWWASALLSPFLQHLRRWVWTEVTKHGWWP